MVPRPWKTGGGMKPTPIVEKHYQLILWLLPKMANYPKDQRFLLADRTERILLDILEMLIEAVYAKDHRHDRPNADRFADGHRLERSTGSDGRRPILAKVNLKLDT